MSLTNKSFRDNKTGQTFKIIDSYGNIAITDGKEKIDVGRLFDNTYYTEQIDPNTFLNNSGTYNVFAEKIKGVDLNSIPDDSFNVDVVRQDNEFSPLTNEPAVMYSDPESEMEELKRKYNVSNVDDSVRKQNEAFSKLLNDEVQEEQPSKNGELIVDNREMVQTRKQYIEAPVRIDVEDPIITMFNGVKKSVDFSFELKIKNKIPRLDFIEMMEDSYDISIIDYLAEEFTKEILKNPGDIKIKIKEKIKSLLPKKEEPIYKEPEVKVSKPRKKRAVANDKGIIP